MEQQEHSAGATRIQIKSRWFVRVLYECDVPSTVASGMALRHALEKAVNSGAVLRDADLRGADLSGADLSGAYLSGAYLSGADLRGAVLRDAVLSGADLSDAVLSGADLSDAVLRDAVLRDAVLRGAVLRGAVLRDAVLSGADLSDAVLRDAVLSGADLRGAVLRDAVLRGAVLRGAVLSGADLRGAVLRDAVLRGAVLRDAVLSGADLSEQKNDFWEILLRAPGEIAGLRLALIEGRVDGSTYEGACACLVGTIANVRAVPYGELGNGIKPDSGRPAEQWFMNIRNGDTPQSNQVSAITVEWLDEFVTLLSAACAVKGA